MSPASTESRGALVVIVDDELGKVQALAADIGERCSVAPTEPWQLTEALISEGTVFLIDLFLRDWPERDRLPASARVYDGIALAAMIRAQARHLVGRTPIVALNTGHAGDFSDLPREIREHAIARAHNLEWVFLKNDSVSPVPTHERVFELLDGQKRLPAHWNADSGEQQLLTVLDAAAEELSEVLDAWPPIREVGRTPPGSRCCAGCFTGSFPTPRS